MSASRTARWKTNLIWMLAIVLVYFGVRAWQTRDLPQGPAPQLQGVLLDGRGFDLAQTRGAPMLVYFWASWCPICRVSDGAIDALSRDYPVVTIAMQSGSDAEVSKFLREEGLRFPVLNDPEGVLAREWRVRGVPAGFIIDRNGDIRFVEMGFTSGWGWRARLWLAGNL